MPDGRTTNLAPGRRRSPALAVGLAVLALLAALAIAGRPDRVTIDAGPRSGVGTDDVSSLTTQTTLFTGTMPPSTTTTTSTVAPPTVTSTSVGSTTSSTSTSTSLPRRPITTAPTVPVPNTTAAPTTALRLTGGYRLMYGVTRINPRLTIRFLGPVPAEVLYSVDAARRRINDLTGASWVIGAPTTTTAGRDEIVITMRQNTACAPPQNGDTVVFACSTRRANAAIVSVDTEINPAIVGTSMLYTTVLHEMGHAAGLDDFDERFAGAWQLMRSSCVVGLSDYQLGDRNGLTSLRI